VFCVEYSAVFWQILSSYSNNTQGFPGITFLYTNLYTYSCVVSNLTIRLNLVTRLKLQGATPPHFVPFRDVLTK
jgi:hypothetical protein